MTVAGATRPASVPAIRSFIRGQRHRRWYDWYAMAFMVALVAFVLSDFLAAPFNRLLTSGSTPPPQAQAGAALVIAAGAGLVMLAQLLGPLALSPADASWLLLSPLDRRAVLRRPARTVIVLCVVTGALLGVLALTMAGPYLRHGARPALWAWLLTAATSGAGFFVAVVLIAVLSQPRPRWRARLRAACAAVAVAAALAALSGQRWAAIPRHVIAVFADLSTSTAGVIAVAAVVIACAAGLLVLLALPRFPAGVLSTDSARAGMTRLAAAYLNVPLLTWIAEDSHWRGRLLKPRRWPRAFSPDRTMTPAWALAWVDWRRLARRPALLFALAGGSLAPAVVGTALTGHARGYGTAAVLLGGALAAAVQGTAATRRDSNDPALFRLLGVDFKKALSARAVLPALLGAAWLLLAFTVLVLAGVLSGWLWPLTGLAAGPGLAVAALRIARTGPVNPADQGPDTPLGPIPPWLIVRAGSVLVGVLACYPVLAAVPAGRVHAGTLAAQLAVSAIVLGGYLLLARDYRA
ncbi:MAG TPA: DUF6297 family protein [Streptosporangiaceae bacterium]